MYFPGSHHHKHAPKPLMLDIADDDPVAKILESIKGENLEEKREAILCKLCERVITTPDELTIVNERFIHTFTNPAGLTFEVQCYMNATGVLISGTPTDHFSWFPGYTWRYCYCDKCHTHLGWHFKKDDDGFFGFNIATLKGDL